MKRFLNTVIILAMVTTGTTVLAQPKQDEYLGLPGDNLNLYAVMKLFQESQTLEGFERNLNDENSRINNLDLNGDNLIDYIKVIDNVDGNVHNIVLRVAINKYENQDVAVFNVQRFADGKVQIQLIGDEALYGKNYIIEPYTDGQYASETPNPGYAGNQPVNVTVVRTTPFEIAYWPLIRFIFAPDYVCWHSSWYWGYWPEYWHPWRPFFWHYYYGYNYHWFNDYYRYYHRCDYTRYDHWNDFRYSHRYAHSDYVMENIREGHYRATYSHPDQRREGEAMYARTHNDNINRRVNQFSDNNNQHRITNGSSDYRRDAGTNKTTGNQVTAGRRNADVQGYKPSNNQVVTHNTNNDRRFAPVQGVRQSTPQATTHIVTTERRAVPASNNRSSNQPLTAYNSVPDRRSANTMSGRAASYNRPTASIERSRPSGRPAAQSFAPKRSSSQSQPARAAKSSGTKGSGRSGKADHRR